MIMKRLLCGILVFFCFFLTACTGKNEIAFQTVLDDANALHKAQTEMTVSDNIEKFKPVLPITDVGFTEGELVSLTKGLSRTFNGSKQITRMQAEQDVKLLFRVLKYCYTPYVYFGGDKVFGAAQDAILDDLAILKSPFEVNVLVSVLKERLAFIKDGHFLMNATPIPKMYSYFSADELVFEQEKRGYCAQVDGKKQYLLSVNGDTDIKSYMKLSIGPDGGLTYRLGMLDDANARSIAANAAFEKSVIVLTLDNIVLTHFYDRSPAYSENREGIVPVVVYRDCMQHDFHEEFLSSAKRLRGESVAIIDLRGNGGGSGDLANEWLNVYDPEGIAKNGRGVGLLSSMSRASGYLSAYYLRYNPFLSQLPGFNYEECMELYRHGWNWYERTKNDDGLRFFESDGLLFVLMDSHTISAGEWLLSALRTRENTVFIGMNSAGMLLGGTGEQLALPNSGIRFTFGFSLLLSYDERVFEEGRGFLPDIWVSGDALERVQKLIEYYGLLDS
jgi:hypothetical protein